MGNSHIKLSDWIFDDAPETGLTLPGAVVSYWKMDEVSGNALDSVGSNTLYEVGTVAAGVDGIFGNYRYQFGTNSYFSDLAEVANPLWRNDSAGLFVFEIFVQVTDNIGYSIQPIYASPWPNTYGVLMGNLEYRDSNTSFRGHADSYRAVYGNSDVIEDTWYHIMIAKIAASNADGSQILIINGELVDTAGAEDDIGSAVDTEFRIGRSNVYDYSASNLKLCDAAYWTDMTLDNVPGTGNLTERLVAISAARYNDGAGQQYIIS